MSENGIETDWEKINVLQETCHVRLFEVSPDVRRFVKAFGKKVRPQQTPFQIILGKLYTIPKY